MCGYEPSTKNNALFARKILYDMKRNRSDSLPISVINTAINACAWTSGDLATFRNMANASFQPISSNALPCSPTVS